MDDDKYIKEQIEERVEWASNHGLNLEIEELRKIIFLVTEDGKPMIVNTGKEVNIAMTNLDNTFRRNNIIPAIMYDGFWHTRIATSTNLHDKDEAIIDLCKKYSSNAVVGLDIDTCVGRIIQDSLNIVTYLKDI